MTPENISYTYTRKTSPDFDAWRVLASCIHTDKRGDRPGLDRVHVLTPERGDGVPEGAALAVATNGKRLFRAVVLDAPPVGAYRVEKNLVGSVTLSPDPQSAPLPTCWRQVTPHPGYGGRLRIAIKTPLDALHAAVRLGVYLAPDNLPIEPHAQDYTLAVRDAFSPVTISWEVGTRGRLLVVGTRGRLLVVMPWRNKELEYKVEQVLRAEYRQAFKEEEACR
jgi:hypothetical protein